MAKAKDLRKIYADLLQNTGGKVRGEAIISRMAYIRHQKGEAGVRAVGKKLKEAGCRIELGKLQSLSWYPEACGIVIILAAQEVFGWGETDIFAMGENAPKISFLVKLLMKYFVSVEKTFLASPANWRKHHTTGTLEAFDFNSRDKHIIIRLKDYKAHPAMCVFLRGYFSQFARMVIKSEKIEVRETKCMFAGADCHEFSIIWQ